MIGKESSRGEAARIIGEVAVFCTLCLLGGGLFVLVVLTNIAWFYPTLFFGAVLYVAAQRYFYFGPKPELLDSEEHRVQEEALQAYLDQMSNLIVDREMRKKTDDPDLRRLAQALTLAILLRLDRDRKRLPLKLIYELSLIMKEEPILSLKNAGLDTADLSEITLHDASLREADLRLANLSGADLKGSDLRGADLRGANLSDANLSDTLLAGANLLPYDETQPAKLNAPSLSNGVDPSDIDLSKDHLTPTNLRGADLSNAALSGALLTGAQVSEEQLVKCKSLQGATMPDGQILKSDDNPYGLTFQEWLGN